MIKESHSAAELESAQGSTKLTSRLEQHSHNRLRTHEPPWYHYQDVGHGGGVGATAEARLSTTNQLAGSKFLGLLCPCETLVRLE